MKPATILLVEDNRLLRNWMATSLEGYGYRVHAPDSVTGALVYATTHELDALVTDWHLQGGSDGLEVLEDVRAKHPRVTAILISADADAALVQRAKRAGFDAVLEKPFPPWKIAAVLESLVPAPRVEAV